MIHHVSISARQPQHVAEVLAEIMRGRCYLFPGGVAPPPSSPFHFLLSVPATREEVERIGAREGWRTKLFGRGAGQKPLFRVIEFWIREPADGRGHPQRDYRGIHAADASRAVQNRFASAPV